MNGTNSDDPQQPVSRGASARDSNDEQRRRVQFERLRDAGRNLGVQLEEQVHKRPYVVLGAAAGAGLVAGSLFGRRLGQVLLAAGVGYVARNVVGGGFDIDRIQAGLERLAGERGPRGGTR